ncbi:unnamed protein product [Caenorhabditis angaria]|uniref:PAN-3 domain-containing protein n=1 Tax=Caenorhabditis angaria TaxID=860376 RepID=A0A9P1MYH3_9PELO|nr:unnamed protein product [Caenorhabditis angaria]
MLLVFVFLLLFQQSQSKIVTIAGRPVEYSGLTVLATNCASHTICGDKCANLNNCAAVYYKTSNRTCISYNYGNLFSILKIDSSPVAEFFSFKTNTTTCPKSPAKIYYSKNYTYTATGTHWQVEGPCPRNWYSSSSRPKGTWCMNLFLNTSRNFTEVYKFCNNIEKSATISGIASQDELWYIVSTGYTLHSPDVTMTIAIDGRLMDKYTEPSFPDRYAFYDKYLTTYKYNFAAYAPNSNLVNGQYKRCLILWSIRSNQVPDAAVQDMLCSTKSKMYVCGRAARYL